MVELSTSGPTILLNIGIILVLASAIFGGILYQQFTRECNFNKDSPLCTYTDFLKSGIIVFGALGVVIVLVGFALSVVGGLEGPPLPPRRRDY